MSHPKPSQSAIAQSLLGTLCEEFVFDTLRCQWCRWSYELAKWEPVSKIAVLKEIQNELDRLLPLGYSAATLTGVERLIRVYLAKRLPIDQTSTYGFATTDAYERWQAHKTSEEGAE